MSLLYSLVWSGGRGRGLLPSWAGKDSCDTRGSGFVLGIVWVGEGVTSVVQESVWWGGGLPSRGRGPCEFCGQFQG